MSKEGNDKNNNSAFEECGKKEKNILKKETISTAGGGTVGDSTIGGGSFASSSTSITCLEQVDHLREHEKNGKSENSLVEKNENYTHANESEGAVGVGAADDEDTKLKAGKEEEKSEDSANATLHEKNSKGEKKNKKKKKIFKPPPNGQTELDSTGRKKEKGDSTADQFPSSEKTKLRKSDSKSDSKSGRKSDSKSGRKSDSKSNSKSDSKSDSKSGSKNGLKDSSKDNRKSREKNKKGDTEYEETAESDAHNYSAQSANTEKGGSIYMNEEIDESDDEYTLNTLGNFDLNHYEDFDIIALRQPCGFDVASTQLLHGFYTASTRLLHGFYTAATRLLHGCYTAATRLLHRCDTAATQMRHRCDTTRRPCYDIDGNKIQKNEDNTIDDFLQSKKDPNAWRKIKDKKNNRIVELTDTDLEIIRRIRENRVATYINDSNYIYENDKEEYKLPSNDNNNFRRKKSKGDKEKIRKFMTYLKNKEKYPEKYHEKEKDSNILYDLWNNKIYDEYSYINDISLPNILPGHKFSYNPPQELLYKSSEKKKILKINKNAFIPKNYEQISNIEYYNRTYFDLYQRCLDLYLCSRTLKNVLHINKEDLLPKLPSRNSLKPYPQYPFIKYIMNDDLGKEKHTYFNHLDINEQDHIMYIIQCDKLYIFDILTSYNIATIDLTYYYKWVKSKDKSVKGFFDNIMIKVNKSYPILAVSCGSFIILFHYESYYPPVKSSSEHVEDIHHTDVKRRKNVHCNDVVERDSKGEDHHGTDVLSSYLPDKEKGTSDLSSGAHMEDNLDEVEEEKAESDEEDLDEVEYVEEDLDEEQLEGEDLSNASIEEKNNKFAEDENNDECKGKGVNISKNIIYFKTKGLLSVYHENFKNSNEYSCSPDVDVTWMHITTNDRKIKFCAAIKHEGKIKNFSWNRNGNYLSVTCLRKVGQYHYCYLHHLKSMKSIKLIKKYKQKRGDIVQTVFFPRSPYFLVAFENSITIYNLKARFKKEQIIKDLKGVKNVTSVDVHANESYILAADKSGNVFIFDLDLSCSPYKRFHLQDCALKKVEFHKIYNLFYALSSNGTVNLFYSKFFQDYITNPVLLPIKTISNESKITDLTWSGKKPWLFAHTECNFSVLYT
ncbi:ribosome biogenesis protein BOP1, putative (BOP1) [Plasmodium ovale curtisi]|uniref:Ribosome biogenesis protein BOP1, putative (BOP1) n=1 Tax=Plasmodium ovale curtisi TaxID=864141 RepID=A0A1A8WXV1_PLAOA|nr:ribosome biogenesis protein BOP1, putative (BOP1) [Plasmodium ovale curtisi]